MPRTRDAQSRALDVGSLMHFWHMVLRLDCRCVILERVLTVKKKGGFVRNVKAV